MSRETTLTPEDIKKIFDNFEVEGFGLINWSSSYCTFSCALFEHDTNLNDFNILNDLWHDVGLPLFLQRVIEGINKSRSFGIEQNWLYVKVCEFENIDRGDKLFNLKHPINNNLIQYDIDEAKTQAIKYILEQL